MNLIKISSVVIKIALVVAMAELAIMVVLPAVFPDHDHVYLEALLDVALLTAIATPPIYLWVIRPFVTQRDRALDQVQQLAMTDPLTDLPNRRYMDHHLSAVLASVARHRQVGAVMMLDLDGFKPINDGHGHEAGDHVLIEVARRIRRVTRAEDVAARMGGDEFLLLCPVVDDDLGVATAKIRLVADKVIQALSEPYSYAGRTLTIGVSVGVRLLFDDGVPLDRVLVEVDAALYRAKLTGKGRVMFAEPTHDTAERATRVARSG